MKRSTFVVAALISQFGLSIGVAHAKETQYPPWTQAGVANCTCPGTNVEFYLDGRGGAQLASVQSNYYGFTEAARVRQWKAMSVVKDGQRILVLDNGLKTRIMADPETQKSMGFTASGGVSPMLCQILVKPQ
jgi:hypothetical protein